METTKLNIELSHKTQWHTVATVTIVPGDRLRRLLEIVDGINPEHVKQVFRTIGGFLGIPAEGDGDDGNNTDSEPSPDRAANLV